MKTKAEKKLEKKMKKTLSRDEFKKVSKALNDGYVLKKPNDFTTRQSFRDIDDIDLVKFVEEYRKECREKKIREFFTSIRRLPGKLLGLPKEVLKLCIRFYYRCQSKQKLIREFMADMSYPTPFHRYLGILPKTSGDFKDLVVGEPTVTFYEKQDYRRKTGGKFVLSPNFVKQSGPGEVYIHSKWVDNINK